MNTAIEFNHISKQYRLGLVSTRTLSHDLNRWWTVNVLRKEDPYLKIGETNDRSTKGNSEYVWALRDIDFKIEQGDVVGIIGKNGAGKSTLLKLLSRVTAPTTGIIRAKGRIASLLEVGTGFHPEMTGRENIFMNGAIMGMTKSEIRAKLDEIVDFSGCERYLDTPVKRYSSGMMVRLGFAVAAHLDPEILVVDEVLAVGDAEFQKKAIGKMQDVSRGEGRTVLFVSHNMTAIERLCGKCVLINKGMVEDYGLTPNIVKRYVSSSMKRSANYIATEKKDVCINNAFILNRSGCLTDVFNFGEQLTLKLNISNKTTERVCCSVGLWTMNDILLMIQRFWIPVNVLSFDKELNLVLDRLLPDTYKLSIALYIPNVQLFDYVSNALSVSIVKSDMNYGVVEEENGLLVSSWK